VPPAPAPALLLLPALLCLPWSTSLHEIGTALALAAALALFVWDRAGARPGRAEAQ